MNSSTEYIDANIITVVNGKKKVQGIKYNQINENGKPMMINRDRWLNKKHKRFSWINPTYRNTKKMYSKRMPISNGKKTKRKSKKNIVH